MATRISDMKQGMVDKPKTPIDEQKRLSDNALNSKKEIKSIPLSRLHGLSTTVRYYKQKVSNRLNNLSNVSSLNKFDPNTVEYERIEDFILLTTEEISAEYSGDIAKSLSEKGSGVVLPNTIVPTPNDYFVMEVMGSYNLYVISDVNPTLVEKDSGYSIEFSFKTSASDINVASKIIEDLTVDSYNFDYNHVGTRYRTVFKTEVYEFLDNSRNLMYDLMKIYNDSFYNKTLNTYFLNLSDLNTLSRNSITSVYGFESQGLAMTKRDTSYTMYDPYLVRFINNNCINSSNDDIYQLNQYVESEIPNYRNTIFYAIEKCMLNRVTLDIQNASRINVVQYGFSTKLYGRILVDHRSSSSANSLPLNLFPTNFLSIINNYDSTKFEAPNLEDTYNSVIEIMVDMISLYLNEENKNNRIRYSNLLLNILYEHKIDGIYADEQDPISDIFYVYPLFVYVLKYLNRELSDKEFN